MMMTFVFCGANHAVTIAVVKITPTRGEGIVSHVDLVSSQTLNRLHVCRKKHQPFSRGCRITD